MRSRARLARDEVGEGGEAEKMLKKHKHEERKGSVSSHAQPAATASS